MLISQEDEGVRLVKSMRKNTRRIAYAIAGIAILAIALIIVWWLFWNPSQGASLSHLSRRAQPSPAGAVDQQMLKGKFGTDVPADAQQNVLAELGATDRPLPNQARGARTPPRPGEQQIVITQPLGTTVEDTQPTLTWDALIDGWTYRVHIEDRDSHQTVATSPALDEALWQIPIPLQRGHTYLWRVEASSNGNRSMTTTSQTALFSVLSDEGEREIQNLRTGHPSHLLLGSFYTHYGMWREAVLEYRQLVDEVPDSAEATKLLRNAEIRSNSQLASPFPR